MSRLRIDDIESALITLLAADLKASGWKVRGASSEDFDSDGAIIAPKQTVLVVLESGAFASLRDMTKTNYQPAHRFNIIAGDANFSSRSDEREGLYSTLEDIFDSVAGARLKFDNDASGNYVRTTPITLVSFAPLQIDAAASWYSITVEVGGITQFSGKNA